MGSFLADALWSELRHGVLARSRAAHDRCVTLHAAGDVDGLVRQATEAFGAREDNFKEALDEVWAFVDRRDKRRDLDRLLEGRRHDLMEWLYDVAVAEKPAFANSRFFLDPPLPDRVWVQRGTSWDLAWRHDGDWRLKSLKEVRAAKVDPHETLLVVRVAGRDRPNPKLPSA